MAFALNLNRNTTNPYPLPSRPSHKAQLKRIYFFTTLALILSLILYLTTHSHTQPPPTFPTIPWIPARSPSSIRIAKACILYTPSDNQSLALHSAQNDHFGYPMHILRVPIVRGFANPLLWLQYLIIAELSEKRVEERVEWILYVFLYPISFRISVSISYTSIVPSKSIHI
jgi:hypothetical protein